MEIYSPKKFQQASFKNNQQVKENHKPKKGETMVTAENKLTEEDESRETLSERMKRVFYERLNKFFQYEEVS